LPIHNGTQTPNTPLTIETSTFRPRRTGHRKRKSVRGCIVGPDLAVISLAILKKGDTEIEGVTDTEKPRRLGPKRANYIRKVFALRKKDDVRKYVVRREIKRKDKTFFKAPKIQRLITETRLRRKKLQKKAKKEGFKRSRDLKAKYEKVLSQYIKEKKSLQEAHKKEKEGAAPEKHEVAKKNEPVKKVIKPAEIKKEPVVQKKAEPVKQQKQAPSKPAGGKK
jgi:small subunit ribosomal protein S6e